jgi:putative DNA base modification enzyme with NMAD domain
MKIILSRKGIDSGAQSGKMASPILPCGCLCSIPIPYRCGISYSDVPFGTRSFQQIIRELNPRWSNRLAHLDPDLRRDAVTSRPSDWRPAFGQIGAAAGHLINQGVGVGDLFVFFGWFRRTIEQNGKLTFDPQDVHGRHIVFGWLEVGHVIDSLPLPKGLHSLSDHPHVQFFEDEVDPNRIYVSSLSGLKAGTFQTDRELQYGGVVQQRNWNDTIAPTKLKGDCEEIANPSTAYSRRRRNWIDAHGSVPPAQVVDASCGNEHCIALRHAYLRPRVEQPRKYRKIADRVHRLKVGQHFDVPGVGTDERSRNRFRSGLYAAARLDKVSVRGQPDRSVRITKVGGWSSVRG